MWGGLRVGWIRAGEPHKSAVIARKSALNLGTAAISQALAAQLLAASGQRRVRGRTAPAVRPAFLRRTARYP
jgi:DNA-binding transcriptional MocR family regulator